MSENLKAEKNLEKMWDLAKDELASTADDPHTQEARKTRRLNILAWTLSGILGLILVSIVVTAYFGYASIEISTELIVINAILGSSLTTIIGVIAGTSID